MKKLFLWALIPLLVFVSCSDDLNEMSGPKKDLTLANEGYPAYFSIMKVPSARTTKAGIPTTEKTIAKWNDFDIIKIYFMNGTANTALINKVKTVAETYTELTNLRFKYVTDPNESDVRIVFSNHDAAPELNYLEANWSYLGKQCQAVSKSEPTMNLAIANINNPMEVNSPEFKASILREFGHMLGMIYEYQRDNPTNPDERVVLNENNVLDGIGVALDDYLGEYQIGNSYLLEHFYLIDLLIADTITPTFDENSIMLPYIPADWIVTTGRVKTSTIMFNKIKEKTILDLSANDRAYIAAVYPKPLTPPTSGLEGNITISLASLPVNYGGGLSYPGWDYRIGTSGAEITSRIINDYPTIGIGEYEWTTVNLRLKYRGESLNFLNYDNTMVNFLAGSAFGDDANTVNKFEKVFGTWITEIATNDYNQATSYRYDDAAFTRNDDKYPSANVEFDLPDVAAILQMFGQMPHTTGNVYKDFRNYTFGLPDGVDPQLAADLAQVMPLLNGVYNLNTSKLSLLPLGSMDAHGLGEAPYVYEPHPGWTNGSNAFMTTGTGVKLKMKGGLRNFNFAEPGNNNEIRLNQQLWHWGSVRYCRAIPDEELGYRLYTDESSNSVVYLPSGEEPETGYVELSRGVQRGVALSYLYTDKEHGIYYFTKSWSKIQQEAAAIRSSITYIYQ
ncbi:MAG: hypothetical protein LBL79_15655 [Prevotella sp.]|jgi:hypothetical protein|nr:hypothetical protein [Prevotella sp.]